MRASIDLGTNTCLLLIQADDGSVLHDQSEVVRLGEGLAQYQQFQPQAMQRTIECLKKYASVCSSKKMPVENAIAVATASARDSKNTSEFFAKIKAETGFNFITLTGDQEAQATFKGAAVTGTNPAEMIVMDIGGGSTELVSVEGGKSINIGAVKVTEMFLKSDPVTDTEFWAAEDFIDSKILDSFPTPAAMFRGKKFVTVAGTATTLAQLQLGLTEFSASAIDGCVITKGDVHRWVEELKWRTVEERKLMKGMEIKRADVLLGGALIYWRVMQLFNFAEGQVSTRGLRYGVFDI